MADRHDADDERAERGGRRALPVFSGKAASFPIWKARVRAWLSAETPSLLYVLEDPDGATEGGAAAAAPTAASVVAASGGGKKKRGDQQLERDKLKVYNALISSLDDAHVGMIVTEVSEGDALGAWRILLRKYERNTAASRNQLRRELHSLKMNDAESVDVYKARALHLAARLRSMKEGVSDGELLYCLMEGLPSAYAMVRQALEVQDVVDLEEACVHLREVEDKLRRERGGAAAGNKAAGSTADDGALVNGVSAERWPRRTRPKCLVCGRSGHWAPQCRLRCHEGCFRCGGSHVVRDCEEDYARSGDSDNDGPRDDDEDDDDRDSRQRGRRPRPQTPKF
jgi:hypothetical protein